MGSSISLWEYQNPPSTRAGDETDFSNTFWPRRKNPVFADMRGLISKHRAVYAAKIIANMPRFSGLGTDLENRDSLSSSR